MARVCGNVVGHRYDVGELTKFVVTFGKVDVFDVLEDVSAYFAEVEVPLQCLNWVRFIRSILLPKKLMDFVTILGVEDVEGVGNVLDWAIVADATG